jgi:hypothetical protein
MMYFTKPTLNSSELIRAVVTPTYVTICRLNRHCRIELNLYQPANSTDTCPPGMYRQPAATHSSSYAS